MSISFFGVNQYNPGCDSSRAPRKILKSSFSFFTGYFFVTTDGRDVVQENNNTHPQSATKLIENACEIRILCKRCRTRVNNHTIL
jgi:hypothetical protein